MPQQKPAETVNPDSAACQGAYHLRCFFTTNGILGQEKCWKDDQNCYGFPLTFEASMIQSPIKKYVKLNLGVCETLQVSNTPWSSHVLLQYWFVSIPVGVVTTNAHQQWGSMRLIRMATMSHNVCGCVFSMPKNRRRYLENLRVHIKSAALQEYFFQKKTQKIHTIRPFSL